MTIALLDVHYQGAGAHAACLLADSWESESLAAGYTRDIEAVEPYEPGNFYLRELPCLLAVLELLPSQPQAVIIDGYVWLAPGDRPGLGARLFEALGQSTSVVGIAKTAFAGAQTCANVIPVLRGASRRPLFVTAAGMSAEVAAEHVRRMAGPHRIPELVRLADRLSRTETSGSENPTQSKGGRLR